MPYGLPQNLQNETNDQWMEDCVASVMDRAKSDSGMSKGKAVAICKTQLVKHKGRKNSANIGVINRLLDLYSEERKKK